MERGPEHTDDTPLRPVDDQVERDAADTVVDEDTDFTDQPLGAAVSEVVEGEGDASYFAPTDPVTRPGDRRGETEMLGGFAPGAEPPEADRSAEGRVGDEALADAVRTALARDAATVSLAIRVTVRDGVVTLRGPVDGPEDADSAEAVVGAVRGVREVVDETTYR